MSFMGAFLAMILDRFVVLPHSWTQGLVVKIGHPVIWQGKLIEWLEKRLNRTSQSSSQRRVAGGLMFVVLIGTSLSLSVCLVLIITPLPFAWVLEACMGSVFLAHRGLHDAVKKVANSLKTSLSAGRQSVGHIVGRDTKNLDEHEICRGAIESLAENSSDGIIAPLFWMALFGLPGIVVYKAINTADSMVGHKSERYMDFGWASAKIDDLVNWVPARLTALFYVVSAMVESKNGWQQSLKTALRDAPTHVSPNAGWPEAALAGALGFGLGGPRAYAGKKLDLPNMGSGKRDLVSDDIYRALKLSANMSSIALIVVGLAALIGFLV